MWKYLNSVTLVFLAENGSEFLPETAPLVALSPCSSALMTPQPSDTREWLEIPMKLPVKAVFWQLFSLWRSWKTCCPHGQSHPSSVETRRRSTCKIMTSARARHLVTAGRPTMTARTKRAATTAREYSVPTSNLMRFPTLTYTHTDTHNPWARWEKMYELQTKQRQVRLSSSSDTDPITLTRAQVVDCLKYCALESFWFLSEELTLVQPETDLDTLNSNFR